MSEQRWVFVVKSLDRPGVLTAAASVFSNRGVSLEAVLGSGIASTRAEDARFILSFRATERKKEMLLRVLERLSAVIQVDAYLYDDPRLRSIAVAKVSSLAGIDLDTIVTESISESAEAQTLLLTGTTVAIEQFVEDLRQKNQLIDVVITVIAI